MSGCRRGVWQLLDYQRQEGLAKENSDRIRTCCLSHPKYTRAKIAYLIMTMWGNYTAPMTSFDYQNALRAAIVLSSCFSFVKNCSCVTQIYITKITGKCILVVALKLRIRLLQDPLLTPDDSLSTDHLWSTLCWPSIIHSLLTIYNPLSTDRQSMIHSLLTPDYSLSTDRLWSTLYWPSIIHSLLTVRLTFYWSSIIHSIDRVYNPLSTDHLWSTLYCPRL